ncbi:hypothetical protein [Saliphagus sp. LR7]|uniref:zinc finger domain-containing protein n=1 Tax=Saliphagus sp. LR7 TaxID=2282654 RepID=UPI0018E5A854|nr:hypothetical protein [Saliphagus sp. LR7]
MASDIDPVKAAVTCEDCGVGQPYHPVLAVECPDCGAVPGRKCQRPSGHRVRTPHADRINAAYEAGYTKCPCKTDNAVICAGSTAPEDVPFDTDAVTIEATPDEVETLDPDALLELPCSLGDEGLPPVGSQRTRQANTNTNANATTHSSSQQTLSSFDDD